MLNKQNNFEHAGTTQFEKNECLNNSVPENSM